MAIAHVATAQIYSGSDDPVSGSINLGSTDGRAVVVHITVGDSYTVTGASITGGTALTLIDSGTFSSGAYAKRYVYAGVVSETGSQTITVTTDAGGGTRYGTVVAYSGVSSVRGGTSGSNNADPNNQPSMTVTTVSGDTVVLLGHDGERGITFTPGSGATERFDTGGAYAQDEIASGTSTTASGTMSAPGYWSAGAVALVPSGGGGGSSAGAAAHYYRQQG